MINSYLPQDPSEMAMIRHPYVMATEARRPAVSAPWGLDTTARDLARMLWDRRWVILATTLAFALVAFLVGLSLPKSYQAEGLLVVNTQEINIPDFQTIRSQGTIEPWGARSAARVLGSRELVENTAHALQLISDPVFNRALRQATEVDDLLSRLWRLVPFSSNTAADEEAASSEPRETDFDRMIAAIRRNLVVFSEERSYAITVRFTWTDPVAASRLVNGLMQQFVAQEMQAQRWVTVEANERLKQQGEELHSKLSATQKIIRELENSKDLVITQQGSVIAQRVVTLGVEQQEVENTVARVRADLDQVDAAIASGTANLLNAELVTPRLKALMESQSEMAMQERMVRAVVELGPKHPRYLAIQMQLDQLKRDIRDEASAIAASLRKRLDSLRRQQVQLAAEAETLKSRAAGSASKRTELDQLRAEETSQQRLYDIYEERYRQTLANMEVLQPQIRIGARALPPTRPSSLGPNLLAMIGALLGALVAVAAIVGERWWFGRINSFTEVRTLTGLPVIGAIPWVKRGLNPKEDSRRLAEHLGGAAMTESIRGILFRLREVGPDVGRVVQISSALPGEGKTSLALSMARVAAHDGLRSLCIDADFRNPSLADRAGVRANVALNDVVNLKTTFDAALVADSASNAQLIIARPEGGKSLTHVGLDRLRLLLEIARDRYDVIIVDSSPVLRVVDPLLLARVCDGVLLTMSEKSATREFVTEAVQRFEAAEARLIGLVIADQRRRIPEQYQYSGYPAA